MSLGLAVHRLGWGGGGSGTRAWVMGFRGCLRRPTLGHLWFGGWDVWIRMQDIGFMGAGVRGSGFRE